MIPSLGKKYEFEIGGEMRFRQVGNINTCI
jgi:hypothetical protein